MSSLLEESNFPQFYDHHFLVKSNSIVLIVLFLHLFCCTHSVVLIDWLIFNLASCRLSGHFGQTATWNYILTFNLPHWNFHFSSSSSSFAWTTHSSARRSLLFILFCIIYPAWKQERHITPSSLVHAQNGPQWPQHFFFSWKMHLQPSNPQPPCPVPRHTLLSRCLHQNPVVPPQREWESGWWPVILYPLSPILACGQAAILKSSRILQVCKDL